MLNLAGADSIDISLAKVFVMHPLKSTSMVLAWASTLPASSGRAAILATRARSAECARGRCRGRSSLIHNACKPLQARFVFHDPELAHCRRPPGHKVSFAHLDRVINRTTATPCSRARDATACGSSAPAAGAHRGTVLSPSSMPVEHSPHAGPSGQAEPALAGASKWHAPASARLV